MLAVEPARLDDLLAVRGEFAGCVLRPEADHDVRRERPRLRTEVADVLHLDGRLLADFSADGVLQAFARIDEAGDKRPHDATVVCVPLQEHLVAFRDEDYHCGRNPRIDRVAAFRAHERPLARIVVRLHFRAAASAEAVGLAPLGDLRLGNGVVDIDDVPLAVGSLFPAHCCCLAVEWLCGCGC